GRFRLRLGGVIALQLHSAMRSIPAFRSTFRPPITDRSSSFRKSFCPELPTILGRQAHDNGSRKQLRQTTNECITKTGASGRKVHLSETRFTVSFENGTRTVLSRMK